MLQTCSCFTLQYLYHSPLYVHHVPKGLVLYVCIVTIGLIICTCIMSSQSSRDTHTLYMLQRITIFYCNMSKVFLKFLRTHIIFLWSVEKHVIKLSYLSYCSSAHHSLYPPPSPPPLSYVASVPLHSNFGLLLPTQFSAHTEYMNLP